MQCKENTTAGSRMSTGRSAYGIRTTTIHCVSKKVHPFAFRNN